NRIWQRLMGRGIVENVDEMDGEPWSPELLDWLASEFVASGYDLKALIATILQSRTYQLPAVPLKGEPPKEFVFPGPDNGRLSGQAFSAAGPRLGGEAPARPAGGTNEGAPAGGRRGPPSISGPPFDGAGPNPRPQAPPTGAPPQSAASPAQAPAAPV